MTRQMRVLFAVAVCLTAALSSSLAGATDPPQAVVRAVFQMLGKSVAALSADEEIDLARNYPTADRIAVSGLTMMGSYEILRDLVDAPPADRDLEHIRQAAIDSAVEALRIAYAASLQIGARHAVKK